MTKPETVKDKSVSNKKYCKRCRETKKDRKRTKNFERELKRFESVSQTPQPPSSSSSRDVSLNSLMQGSEIVFSSKQLFH